MPRTGSVSLEEALAHRRSVREFAPAAVTSRYGERGSRYVQMEAGHAAQNLLMGATALGLGATPVGAFDDAKVSRLLHLQAGQTPLYLIPAGRPASP